MAITEEIRIEIKTQVDRAVADIKKAEKATSSLSDTLKKAAIAAASFLSVKAIVNFGKESVKAYSESEAAVVKLNAALRATGQYTESTSTDMRNFASEMMRLTVIDDDAVIGILQLGINMGLTADQAKKAAEGAIGLSRAYGVDLDAAMKAVTGATQGSYEMLGRYMPAIRTATTEADKMRLVQEGLGSAYAVATAETDTLYGSQEQMKNSIGELKEAMGLWLSTDVSASSKFFKSLADRMAEAIKKAGELKNALNAASRGLATENEYLVIAKAKLDDLVSGYERLQSTNPNLSSKVWEDRIKAAKAEVATLENVVRLNGRITKSDEEKASAALMKADAAQKEAEAEAAKLKAAQDLAAFERAEADDKINRAIDANEKYNELDKQRVESTAATARAQFEWEYARAALEEENHQKRLENAISEMQVYSNYAAGIGQIFSNLINAQMAGDEELTDKKKKNIIALYRMQQAANIAQVGIDTATAIIRQFKDLPFPAAIATSAIIGAIGATQIGLIAATKPPVALAEGGIVMPTPGGTNALIAEAGKPEAVIPLDRLGGLGGNITVNVYGTVGSQEDVATWVYEGITRARQMGKVA
jgi:hypothetical protein